MTQQNERMTGTVSKVILVRGFGFVVGDEDAEEYMVHVSELNDDTKWESMRKGSRLSFIPKKVQGGRGNQLRATDVRFEE